MNTLKREPQWIAAVIVIVVMGVSLFALHPSVDQQGAINAVVIAVTAVFVALTTHDGQLAAIVGLFKALIALGLAFGLHMSPAEQVEILTALTTLASMWLRTQLGAPVPPTN